MNHTTTRLRRSGFCILVSGVIVCAALANLFVRSLSAQGDPGNENGKPPNVIFILADDLGWMDTEVYGSQYYRTPNVDRLAERGVRFTDAYAANPLCSPTRASILTGRDPARLRITTPAGHLPPKPDRPLMAKKASPKRKMITPRSRRFLSRDQRTIGHAFREVGYTTAFMGKWHLGHAPYLPENHGFDVVVGGRHHSGPPGGYFAPWPIGTIPERPRGTHIDDTITGEALQFIEQNRENPFFLNLWFYSVHAPFQAKQQLIETYSDRTDPRGKQSSSTMAAMIETMDHNLGRVMDKIDQLGLSDNTIVVFFSDNGGNMYSRVDGTTPTNNAPLRAGKGNIHEGGVRVPCIVVWPGVTEPGTVSDTPVISHDFYPTLLDMVGLEPNTDRQIDGTSLVPVLRGNPLDRKAIFWHVPHYIPRPGNRPATAVRSGRWKLYRVYGEGPDRKPAYELYNLKKDIGENQNLAEQRPGKVRELNKLIDRYLERTDAIVPQRNPRYEDSGGWTGNKHASVSRDDGTLRFRSDGNDPWIETRTLPEGTPVTVRIRMRIDSKGKGRIYYSTPRKSGFRGHFVEFSPRHDNQWHTYRVKLPVKQPLKALRIDPSTAPGNGEIDWIELTGTDRKVLEKWNF